MRSERLLPSPRSFTATTVEVEQGRLSRPPWSLRPGAMRGLAQLQSQRIRPPYKARSLEEGASQFDWFSSSGTLRPRFFSALMEVCPLACALTGNRAAAAPGIAVWPKTPGTMKEKEGTALPKGGKPLSKSHPHPRVLTFHWPKWHHLPNPESTTNKENGNTRIVLDQ